jgi:hypothetical protein
MKSAIALFAGFAFLGSVSLLTSSAALAQSGCKQSCTALRNGCMKATGNNPACSSGYESCKQTGTYGGMPSGKTHTNICKR